VKIPTGLKAVIIYLIIYGLITELFVFNNWNEWSSAVAGKSPAYALGYFMKGPLLGFLFLFSAYGLSKKQMWGRKLAVVSLLFAAFADINSFARGLAGGSPSTDVVIMSGVIILLWCSIWFYLLFKKSTTEVLY